jgi:hypothetical protein
MRPVWLIAAADAIQMSRNINLPHPEERERSERVS